MHICTKSSRQVIMMQYLFVLGIVTLFLAHLVPLVLPFSPRKMMNGAKRPKMQ